MSSGCMATRTRKSSGILRPLQGSLTCVLLCPPPVVLTLGLGSPGSGRGIKTSVAGLAKSIKHLMKKRCQIIWPRTSKMESRRVDKIKDVWKQHRTKRYRTSPKNDPIGSSISKVSRERGCKHHKIQGSLTTPGCAFSA